MKVMHSITISDSTGPDDIIKLLEDIEHTMNDNGKYDVAKTIAEAISLFRGERNVSKAVGI